VSTDPAMKIDTLRAKLLGSAVGVGTFGSRLATGGRLSGSAALAARAGRAANGAARR